MGDISKGRTYAAGNIVVAADSDEGVNKVSLNDLADNATINPSFISSKVEDTTPDAANDFVVTYDNSTGLLKKVRLNKLPGAAIVPGPSFATITTSTTPTFACDVNKVSQNFVFVLPNSGDATLTVLGVASGMQGILLVAQGSTTPRNLILPGTSYIPGNAASGNGPADLVMVVNRVTACLWMYNGSNYYWSFIKY